MNIYQLFLASCVVFALGLFFSLRKHKLNANHIPIYTLVIFSFFFYSGIFAVSHYFSGRGIDDSVLYHLEYGLDGAGFGEFIVPIVVTLSVLALALILPYVILKHRLNSQRPFSGKRVLLFYLASIWAFYLTPTTDGIIKLASIKSVSAHEVDKRDDFDQYYQKPFIKHGPEKQQNLIYIYAESLEQTYFDEKLFPGLIKHLRQFENKSVRLNNVHQLPGTSWTIAGMVASQCGIPLFGTALKNAMTGLSTFLPKAVCMGDLLANEQYHLAYVGGATLAFAGKGDFYKTHRFHTILGRDELAPRLADPDYQTSWGIYDDSLFEFAHDEIKKIKAQDSPFAMFVLTLDTHNPNGHPSKSCDNIEYADGNNPMLNAVACSDYLISKFINEILDSDLQKNTTIVVASDHLALPNSASHILKKGNRKNFFMAITPEQHQETIATAASMFDAGATVLHLMGFEAKMGFGRSMLNQQAGLLSSLPGFAGALNDWRNSIQSFWGFPVLADKDEIIIDVEKRILTVNDQRYYLPLIMEVGKNKQTQFRFPISNSNEKNGLAVHLVKLAKDRTFLWVDKCSAINTISKPSDAEKYCMLYGQLGGKRVQEELKQSRVIPAQLLTGGQLSQTASHIQ